MSVHFTFVNCEVGYIKIKFLKYLFPFYGLPGPGYLERVYTLDFMYPGTGTLPVFYFYFIRS